MQDNSWLVDIQLMLGSLNHGEVQACSISSVPDKLRHSKEDAFNYKPNVISIGPIHRGSTRQLQLMEETKWHYMREFLDRQGTQQQTRIFFFSYMQTRTSKERLTDCGTDILKLDEVIRASYGVNIELESREFAKIMILDGCFLLELLHKLDNYMGGIQAGANYNEDPILETEEKVLSVLNDITMLENQIPFIVLKKLYRKVFPDGTNIKDDHRVANIVRKVFGYPLVNTSGGVHILHLMHLSTVNQGQHQDGKRATQELLRCAARLRAAGIIILPKPNSNTLNKHQLVDIFDFDIRFNQRGRLDIPTLYVKETTEVKWRNLIAWEQNRIWNKNCKYTSYALFFNGLICCKHDIELLEEKGVIVNECNKSNDDLVTMFRTISKGAEHMDSSYTEMCGRLNVYQRKKVTTALRKLPVIGWHQCRGVFETVAYYWHNSFRILLRDHIPTVWKFIGVVAALLLLVLTTMQTYYSSPAGSDG